jgi:predicted metal-dependent hydrolase
MFNRSCHQPVLIGKYNAMLDNIAICYSLKRSYKAKYIRLEIHRQSGLTIFIPRFYKISGLPDLIQKKKLWIIKKLNEINVNCIKISKKETQDGLDLPYLGKSLKLKTQSNRELPESIVLAGSTLIINHHRSNNGLVRVIEAWYRQQAEILIKKRAEELCNDMDVTYNRLTIRKARTRWGSCSQKGNLNFNWKLILVPEPIIDYIVIHELAHLKEMNHSQRFWNLVAKYCPQWLQHKKWLEEHEADLTISNL